MGTRLAPSPARLLVDGAGLQHLLQQGFRGAHRLAGPSPRQVSCRGRVWRLNRCRGRGARHLELTIEERALLDPQRPHVQLALDQPRRTNLEPTVALNLAVDETG